MNTLRKRLVLATALIGLSLNARSEVIAFDDAYADVGYANSAATYYSGVTFSGTYFGLVGGNGNGDPGNWNLFGTNGSAFLGTNQGIGSGPTITWDAAVNGVSLDVGLPAFPEYQDPNYLWSNDFLVTAYLNGNLVASSSFNISSTTNPGSWHTVAFAGLVDSVTVTLGSGSGFGFGVDNIVWNSNPSVPDSGATLGLLGLSMAAIVVLRRNFLRN